MSICQDLGLNFQQRMGANISQLERDIGSEQFPPNEHYFGLVNFGNTCYSNSVLQALYFCRPFREKVLEYKAKNKRTKETLLTCLADLFYSIATQKKKVGSIAPKKFIARLRKEKEEFDNYMQQDAHEFLNFLINHINEIILAERNQSTLKVQKNASGENVTCNGSVPSQKQENTEPTWVHEIFQGTLTSETRCLNCETVSSKDEHFFDLQVDVGQNTSITHCLKCFSDTETLCNENKFKCDNCSSYQEAQKRMRVKKLPLILALHLKRFKYMEQYNSRFIGSLVGKCDNCSSYQEAQKRMRVKKLPLILALHLKRFKYMEQYNSSYQEAQKRMRVKKLPLILALHLKRFKYMEQYN
ncbi:Ubiquitin carboxyl-terminal hydrolase 46, partial [Castilleja foliolosa]